MLERWRHSEWRDLWCILYGHASGEQGTESRTLKRTRAETSALNGFLRVLRHQADIQFEAVNVGVEALCRICDLFIGVPFREGLIRCKKTQNQISSRASEGDNMCLLLRPRNCDDDENWVRHGAQRVKRGKSHTLRNSFNEQAPQRRLASMPMISCNLMIWGIPRAPKAAAGCSILPCCQLFAHSCLEETTHASLRIAASFVSSNFPWSPRCRL